MRYTSTKKTSKEAQWRADALNFTLALDEKVENWLANLAPHMNAFSLDKPGDLSDTVSISKPVLENIANWYEDRDDDFDPIKRARMAELAIGSV